MPELKSSPATPMTDAEMKRQCQLVSDVASALDYFTPDELESVLIARLERTPRSPEDNQ